MLHIDSSGYSSTHNIVIFHLECTIKIWWPILLNRFTTKSNNIDLIGIYCYTISSFKIEFETFVWLVTKADRIYRIYLKPMPYAYTQHRKMMGSVERQHLTVTLTRSYFPFDIILGEDGCRTKYEFIKLNAHIFFSFFLKKKQQNRKQSCCLYGFCFLWIAVISTLNHWLCNLQ